MTLFVIALLIILVPTLGAIFGIKYTKSRKNEQSPNDQSPLVRQYDTADLRKYRKLFLSFGLLISFGVSSYVYNYEFPSDDVVSALNEPVDTEEEVYEEIPNTEQKRRPKTKPKLQEVVEIPEEVIPEEEPEPEEEEEQEEEEDDIDLSDFEEGDDSGGEGTAEPIDDEIYFFASKIAEFPGGAKALQKRVSDNLNKQLTSRDRSRISDLPRNSFVYVSYVIEKDGSISNIKIERGLPILGLDQKVLNALSDIPKWNPAENNGYKVRLRYTQKLQIQ